MSDRARAALAALSGALVALAFPGPALAPLAFVALAPLIVAVRGASVARGAASGMLAGAIASGAVLAWMAALSALGWVALVLYLGLYVAAFGAAAAALERAPAAVRAPAIVASWVALEWARGWVLGGFGWGALGYALAPLPLLAQPASIGGVPLLSAALVATSVAVAAAAQRLVHGERRAGVLGLGLAMSIPSAMAVCGGIVLARAGAQGAAIRVAVVQGDVSPLGRWERGAIYESMRRYVELTDAAIADRPDVVMWPETAIPAPLASEGPALRRLALERRAREVWRTPVLLGVPEPAGDRTFYNTAIVLSEPATPGTYRKRRLVPFGEYAPFGAGRVLPGPEFVTGGAGAPFAIAGARVGVLICFEDVFPEESLARARDADVLAVITNDGWLDDAGRRQHLDVAILRAIEARRPIARAASTGISALVDPWGRVIASRAAGPGHAIGSVRPEHATTIYARFPDAIPLAAVILAIASLAHVAFAARSRAP